jgi:hypothetical protein
MVMNFKCRILSIIVSVVFIIGSIICCTVIFNKKNDTVIYATNISFNGLIGGIDLYIDNDLIVNENMINIEPKDCNIKPIFTINKYGDDEEFEILNNR